MKSGLGFTVYHLQTPAKLTIMNHWLKPKYISNLSFATVYIAHIDRVVKHFVFRLTWFRFILKQKMNLSRNLRGTNEFGLEVQENVRNVTGIGLTNQNGLTIIGCRESPTTVTERVNIVLKFLGEGECGMITIVIVQRVLFVKKTDFPVNHLIMIFFSWYRCRPG